MEMTGSERINKVFSFIESEIKGYKSPSKIAEYVSKTVGVSMRDLSTVLNFLVGKTLIDYIKERKMILCYKTIVDGKKFDAQAAIQISGLGDQSAFNKAFKKQFGCTPKEAFEQKDRSIITLRMTWDQIGSTETQFANHKNESHIIKTERLFGLERSKFEEIKDIVEFQEVYGCDELQSEIAYYIYQTYDFPLKDTFRFVSEYKYNNDELNEIDEEFCQEFDIPLSTSSVPDDEDDEKLTREEFLNCAKEDADDPEIRYLYFTCKLASLDQVFNMIEKLHYAGEHDVTKVDIDVVNICAFNEIDVKYCKRAIQYYKDHATTEYGDDAFEEFVGYILDGEPIEIAFSSIYELEGWDDFDSDYTEEQLMADILDYDPEDPFEKWANEETDWPDEENDYEDE